MSNFEYIGNELSLFSNAVNWKNYWASFINKYMSGEILEIGAGLGENTLLLSNDYVIRWVCLEPDLNLYNRIYDNINSNLTMKKFQIIRGTLEDIEPGQSFDLIIFIDVLEHIKNDRSEVERALTFLKKGGRIIILSPAIQFLYSNFDASIGHYRRYSRKSLRDIMPESCKLVHMYSLDSVGFFASLANRFFLKQSLPTLKQLRIWDKILVPCSKIVDQLLFYKVGKSILAVWQKT